jgi:hypothetical protein
MAKIEQDVSPQIFQVDQGLISIHQENNPFDIPRAKVEIQDLRHEIA